jgi:hypothetical protein
MATRTTKHAANRTALLDVMGASAADRRFQARKGTVGLDIQRTIDQISGWVAQASTWINRDDPMALRGDIGLLPKGNTIFSTSGRTQEDL